MKSVRHPIGHVSVLVAAVLSSLTAISHANTSFENSPIPQGETNYQNAVFDSQNISLGGGNRLNTPPPVKDRLRTPSRFGLNRTALL